MIFVDLWEFHNSVEHALGSCLILLFTVVVRTLKLQNPYNYDFSYFIMSLSDLRWAPKSKEIMQICEKKIDLTLEHHKFGTINSISIILDVL